MTISEVGNLEPSPSHEPSEDPQKIPNMGLAP